MSRQSPGHFETGLDDRGNAVQAGSDLANAEQRFLPPCRLASQPGRGDRRVDVKHPREGCEVGCHRMLGKAEWSAHRRCSSKQTSGLAAGVT